MNFQLDDLDRKILDIIQTDARIPKTEIARRVSLSPPGLSKRLKKLEEAEVIHHYGAAVSWEAVGFDLLCFIHINFDHHDPGQIQEFEDKMREIPEVLGCYHLTGEFDYLVQAVLRHRRHLERFLLEQLTPVREIRFLRTSVVLREVKRSTSVPLNYDRSEDEL